MTGIPDLGIRVDIMGQVLDPLLCVFLADIQSVGNGACMHVCVHGGNSKGTTCVVDRDVTAYLVVDRVLRFPTEQYGCRYGGYPGFNDVKVIFLGTFC